MLPLSQIATGFLIAFVDVRLDGFDVLVDAIGWLLAALGARKLEAAAGRAFTPAVACAVITLVLSLGDPFAFFGQLPAGIAYVLMQVVTVWLVCEAVISLARTHDDRRTADSLNVLRSILALAMVLGVAAALGLADGWLAGACLLVALASLIGLVIVLYRTAGRPYLSPER